MKKVLALILALAMVASVCVLSGCSSSSTSTADATENAVDGDGAAKAKLTMATNAYFPPYEYYDGSEIVGIDAEVAKAIADDLGMELEIVDIEFDSIIAGVQTGKYDMGMAGMTVTEDRLKSVDFSTSYAKGIQAIIVPEGSEIKSFDDIAAGEYKVGVQLSTTGDIYASDDLADTKSEVVEYQTGNDAVAALVAGKVQAVIIDNEPAKSYVAANTGLVVLETEYVEEDYAICFSKDNTELKDKVNASLEKLIADGTVQKIVDKYINAD